MSSSRPNIVVIGGMKRTGTTWQYNAVRLILEATGDTVFGTGWPYNDIHNPAKWHVVKTHTYFRHIARAAFVVFTSFRPMKDVKASAYRCFGSMVTPDVEYEWNDWQRRWLKYSAYHMSFEDIYRCPLDVIDMLAECLGVPVDAESIYERLQQIKPPTDKDYDPETFLFHNHITQPWTQ